MAQQPTRTNFVNLRNYLQANRQGADQLARGVADTLDSEGSEAQRQLQNMEQDFSRDVTTGSVADPGRYNGWIVYDEDKEAAIKQYEPYGAEGLGYKGPKSLAEREGFAGLTTRVGDVGDRASRANTEFGINDEIRKQQANRPQYTGGMSALDSGLALNSDVGQARLGATQQRFGGLRDAFKGTLDRTNTLATKAGETSAANVKKGKEYLERARGTRTHGPKNPPPAATQPEAPEMIDRSQERADRERRRRGPVDGRNVYTP